MSCNIQCGGRLPYSYNPQGTLQNLAIARSVIRQEEPVRVIIQLGWIIIIIVVIIIIIIVIIIIGRKESYTGIPKPKTQETRDE